MGRLRMITNKTLINVILRVIVLLFWVMIIMFCSSDYSVRLFVKKICNLSIFYENWYFTIKLVLIGVILFIASMILCNNRIILSLIINREGRKCVISITKICWKIFNLFTIIGTIAVLIIGVISLRNSLSIKINQIGSWKGEQLIAHAGGSIDGISYTNSLNAIEQSYKNGFKVFEVDFAYSLDGHMVCKHDWEYNIQEGNESGEVWDKETFLSVPLHGKYIPIDIILLCEFMEEHPDVYIITDTKDTKQDLVRRDFLSIIEDIRISGHEQVLDRFVIQIYNDSMYDTIYDIYPFKNWIFTFYNIWGGDSGEFKDISEFCYQKGINNITCWYMYASDEVLDIAKNYNINVYVHTVNDIDEAKLLLKRGVRGIYTDDIIPKCLEE